MSPLPKASGLTSWSMLRWINNQYTLGKLTSVRDDLAVRTILTSEHSKNAPQVVLFVL